MVVTVGAVAVPVEVNCPPVGGGAVYCVIGRLFPAGNVQADKLGTVWPNGMVTRGCVVIRITGCCVCEGKFGGTVFDVVGAAAEARVEKEGD